MVRHFAICLAVLSCPSIILGSQSFEALATEVELSGVLGFDTYKLSAALTKDAYPYRIQYLDVRINDKRLKFPQPEVAKISNAFIQLITIAHSGAQGTYEIFVPFAGEGYCDDDVSNTRSPTQGYYTFIFNRSLDYVSFSIESPEESCKEGEEYVYID